MTSTDAARATRNVIAVRSEEQAKTLRYLYVVKEILEARRSLSLPAAGEGVDLQERRNQIEICDELYEAADARTGAPAIGNCIAELSKSGRYGTEGLAFLLYFASVIEHANELFVVEA